jgi:hypothetical protein
MPVTIKTGVGGGSVTLDSGTGVLDTTLTLPNINGTVLYSDANGTSNIANITATTLTVSGNVTGNLTIAGTMTAANSNVIGTVVMSSSFKRNRIINGDMKVAQRGTSFSNTAPGSLINHYTLDRWFAYRSAFANNTSVSRQTGFGGSQYCLRHGRIAGDTLTGALLVGQIIESVNMADLQGQTVTLSFWARTGANYSGGSLTVAVVTGTTADEGAAGFVSGWAGISNSPLNTTQAITSTATRYTFTGTVPSNALEIFFYLVWTPTGTAGAADYIEITGVQLEPGTKATPYEFVTFSDQLAQCQRYFSKSYNIDVAPGTVTRVGAVGSYAPTSQGSRPIIPVFFPVSMRTTPTTVTAYSTNNGASGNWYNSDQTVNIAVTSLNTGMSCTNWFVNSALTVGVFFEGHWTASAEL